MLNITLEVHQDGKDTEAQARGVVAALVAIYGPSIIPASYERVGEVERATGPVVINRYEAKAPDGYPIPGTPVVSNGEPAVWDGQEFAPVEPLAIAPDGAKGVGDRDADGILWDERIHTSNKSTKQDGTWKRKPGLDDAYFTGVMIELKAANTARTLEAAQGLGQHIDKVGTLEMGIPTFAAPTAAEAFTPPASVVIPAHVPQPPAPPMPPVPAPPAPPPASTGPLHVPSIGELFQRITPLQVNDGPLAGSKFFELLARASIKSTGELVAANDAKRAEVWALLDTVQ